MSGSADDERPPMRNCCATDFVDRAGLTKINRHIATLHGRLDRIVQIAFRDDVDVGIVFCKIDNRFAHSPGRANEQHSHARFFHRGSPHPSLSLRERRTTKSPSEGSQLI